jgi:ribulose-5-phosphate 4-epimerase/fuculose-1-phosphate aldolase
LFSSKGHPDACAVLVRRHGVYVWGRDWVEAKTMCECFDYLFEMYVSMKNMGIDPSAKPENHFLLVEKERLQEEARKAKK